MIGKSTILWIGLACIASGVLYQTSYKVQEQAERLDSLNRQILREQEAIQVLRAEWAHLNDPARLERLVAEHLLMQATTAAQMVTLDQVPEKVPDMLVSFADEPVPARKPGGPAPGPAQPTVRPDAPLVFARYGAR